MPWRRIEDELPPRGEMLFIKLKEAIPVGEYIGQEILWPCVPALFLDMMPFDERKAFFTPLKEITVVYEDEVTDWMLMPQSQEEE